MEAMMIRRAEQGDLPALLAIDNYYVRETPATFDIEPRTLAQRQAWFDSFAATGHYQSFVAVKDGEPARAATMSARPMNLPSPAASIWRLAREDRGWAGGSMPPCSRRWPGKTFTG